MVLVRCDGLRDDTTQLSAEPGSSRHSHHPPDCTLDVHAQSPDQMQQSFKSCRLIHCVTKAPHACCAVQEGLRSEASVLGPAQDKSSRLCDIGDVDMTTTHFRLVQVRPAPKRNNVTKLDWE